MSTCHEITGSCTLKHLHKVVPNYFGFVLNKALEVNSEFVVHPVCQRRELNGEACWTIKVFGNANRYPGYTVSNRDYSKRILVVPITKTLPIDFDIITIFEQIDNVQSM